LTEPIAENAETVVCPFIDVVAYDTFEYRAQDEGKNQGCQIFLGTIYQNG
jgi:hypothetical protein